MSFDTYQKNAKIEIVVKNSSFHLPKGWTIEIEYAENPVLNQLKIYSPKKFSLPVFNIELRDISSVYIVEDSVKTGFNLKLIYCDSGHSFGNFVDIKLCQQYADEILDNWEHVCFPDGRGKALLALEQKLGFRLRNSEVV
jgi:hypothetical protein